MSFAVLGLRIPGIIITDKECTDKTYPEFWYDLEQVFGVKLTVPETLDAKVASVKETSKQRSIVIVGMRGTGKTTNGSKLASKLGYKFYDRPCF